MLAQCAGMLTISYWAGDGTILQCSDIKHDIEDCVCVPGVARGGAAGPVALGEAGGVTVSGTGGGDAVAGLTRPSKPGMAELGMLKLSCSRCLPESARQSKGRLLQASVGRLAHR